MDYPDSTLRATLAAPDGPPLILTTRHDGATVYVGLDKHGELREVDVSEER